MNARTAAHRRSVLQRLLRSEERIWAALAAQDAYGAPLLDLCGWEELLEDATRLHRRIQELRARLGPRAD